MSQKITLDLPHGIFDSNTIVVDLQAIGSSRVEVNLQDDLSNGFNNEFMTVNHRENYVPVEVCTPKDSYNEENFSSIGYLPSKIYSNSEVQNVTKTGITEVEDIIREVMDTVLNSIDNCVQLETKNILEYPANTTTNEVKNTLILESKQVVSYILEDVLENSILVNKSSYNVSENSIPKNEHSVKSISEGKPENTKEIYTTTNNSNPTSEPLRKCTLEDDHVNRKLQVKCQKDTEVTPCNNFRTEEEVTTDFIRSILENILEKCIDKSVDETNNFIPLERDKFIDEFEVVSANLKSDENDVHETDNIIEKIVSDVIATVVDETNNDEVMETNNVVCDITNCVLDDLITVESCMIPDYGKMDATCETGIRCSEVHDSKAFIDELVNDIVLSCGRPNNDDKVTTATVHDTKTFIDGLVNNMILSSITSTNDYKKIYSSFESRIFYEIEDDNELCKDTPDDVAKSSDIEDEDNFIEKLVNDIVDSCMATTDDYFGIIQGESRISEIEIQDDLSDPKKFIEELVYDIITSCVRPADDDFNMSFETRTRNEIEDEDLNDPKTFIQEMVNNITLSCIESTDEGVDETRKRTNTAVEELADPKTFIEELVNDMISSCVKSTVDYSEIIEGVNETRKRTYSEIEDEDALLQDADDDTEIIIGELVNDMISSCVKSSANYSGTVQGVCETRKRHYSEIEDQLLNETVDCSKEVLNEIISSTCQEPAEDTCEKRRRIYSEVEDEETRLHESVVNSQTFIKEIVGDIISLCLASINDNAGKIAGAETRKRTYSEIGDEEELLKDTVDLSKEVLNDIISSSCLEPAEDTSRMTVDEKRKRTYSEIDDEDELLNETVDCSKEVLTAAISSSCLGTADEKRTNSEIDDEDRLLNETVDNSKTFIEELVNDIISSFLESIYCSETKKINSSEIEDEDALLNGIEDFQENEIVNEEMLLEENDLLDTEVDNVPVSNSEVLKRNDEAKENVLTTEDEVDLREVGSTCKTLKQLATPALTIEDSLQNRNNSNLGVENKLVAQDGEVDNSEKNISLVVNDVESMEEIRVESDLTPEQVSNSVDILDLGMKTKVEAEELVENQEISKADSKQSTAPVESKEDNFDESVRDDCGQFNTLEMIQKVAENWNKTEEMASQKSNVCSLLEQPSESSLTPDKSAENYSLEDNLVTQEELQPENANSEQQLVANSSEKPENKIIDSNYEKTELLLSRGDANEEMKKTDETEEPLLGLDDDDDGASLGDVNEDALLTDTEENDDVLQGRLKDEVPQADEEQKDLKEIVDDEGLNIFNLIPSCEEDSKLGAKIPPVLAMGYKMRGKLKRGSGKKRGKEPGSPRKGGRKKTSVLTAISIVDDIMTQVIQDSDKDVIVHSLIENILENVFETASEPLLPSIVNTTSVSRQTFRNIKRPVRFESPGRSSLKRKVREQAETITLINKIQNERKSYGSDTGRKRKLTEEEEDIKPNIQDLCLSTEIKVEVEDYYEVDIKPDLPPPEEMVKLAQRSKRTKTQEPPKKSTPAKSTPAKKVPQVVEQKKGNSPKGKKSVETPKRKHILPNILRKKTPTVSKPKIDPVADKKRKIPNARKDPDPPPIPKKRVRSVTVPEVAPAKRKQQSTPIPEVQKPKRSRKSEEISPPRGAVARKSTSKIPDSSIARKLAKKDNQTLFNGTEGSPSTSRAVPETETRSMRRGQVPYAPRKILRVRNVAVKSTAKQREERMMETSSPCVKTVDRKSLLKMDNTSNKKGISIKMCSVVLERMAIIDKLLPQKSTSEDPHVCELCEPKRLFITKDGLVEHLKHEHATTFGVVQSAEPAPPVTDGPTRCPGCEKKYHSSNRLALHMKTCPSLVQPKASTTKQFVQPITIKEEPKFICNICDCKFSLWSAYESHRKSHDFNQPVDDPLTLDAEEPVKFQAEMIRRGSGLKMILKRDTSQPCPQPTFFKEIVLPVTYKCDICKSSFGKPKQLESHNRLMHAPKQPIPKTKEFGCKECSQTFPTKQALLSHEYSHRVKKERESPEIEILEEFLNLPEPTIPPVHVKATARKSTGGPVCQKPTARKSTTSLPKGTIFVRKIRK